MWMLHGCSKRNIVLCHNNNKYSDSVSKLSEKAPVKYPLVMCLSVLDPRVLNIKQTTKNNNKLTVQKLTTTLRPLWKLTH